MPKNGKKLPKVLAVSSTGGHWEQLMRLSSAFDAADVTYVCTDAEQGVFCDLENFMSISDCNQDQPLKLLKCFFQAFFIVLKTRPKMVISTGAAPGILCLFWGKLFGARTIWIDSIANSEQLSLSGKISMKFCSMVLSQWESLSEEERPAYRGSVI